MKPIVLVVAALLLLTSVPRAAEQTWSGTISDSACGKKHEEAAEGNGVMPDRECTQACVRGGSRYVLVGDGKGFQIANKGNKEPGGHPGHPGTVTGAMEGDTPFISTLSAVVV